MIATLLRWSGWLALGVLVLALFGFGAALPGYVAMLHPVALLGARGTPHAPGFNLLGFAAPGVLAIKTGVRVHFPPRIAA